MNLILTSFILFPTTIIHSLFHLKLLSVSRLGDGIPRHAKDFNSCWGFCVEMSLHPEICELEIYFFTSPL